MIFGDAYAPRGSEAPVASRSRGGRRVGTRVAPAVLVLLAGCPSDETTAPPLAPTPVTVGEKLFHDPSLSASGQQACASCHVAAQAHADPAGTFLPLGGPQLDRQGFRSSPSLRYLDSVPAFSVLGAGLARGGLFWDGRVDTRAQQARGPLFNPAEMANADPPAFVARLRAAPYFPELLSVTALDTRASDQDLVDAALRAIAAYQAGDPEFHPFSSKYDAFLAGRARLTAQEERGLRLFEDPGAGNCTACHPSSLGPQGERPLFTNFFYFALGVPRSDAQQNADPAFFDLGLCGPQRTDLVSSADLCGMFRVPTLRNVARTAPYFHNGRFTSLRDVVAFYATRDTDPGRWYPTIGGVVQKFDDLPAVYHRNVATIAPFGGLPGDPPALTPQDVDDIVAFLETLTDAAANP